MTLEQKATLLLLADEYAIATGEYTEEGDDASWLEMGRCRNKLIDYIEELTNG